MHSDAPVGVALGRCHPGHKPTSSALHAGFPSPPQSRGTGPRLSADEIASTLAGGPPFPRLPSPRCVGHPLACYLPGSGSVPVSFAPVRLCPPPVQQTWKACGDAGLPKSGYHSGAVRSWERRRARRCAQTRRPLLPLALCLPGRLLPGSSFPRTLCCGPECREFSQGRSQRSSLPNTYGNQGPGLSARVCAS